MTALLYTWSGPKAMRVFTSAAYREERRLIQPSSDSSSIQYFPGGTAITRTKWALALTTTAQRDYGRSILRKSPWLGNWSLREAVGACVCGITVRIQSGALLCSLA